MKISNWFKRNIRASKLTDIDYFSACCYPKDGTLEMRFKNEDRGTIQVRMDLDEAEKLKCQLEKRILSVKQHTHK